eukprot:107739_1
MSDNESSKKWIHLTSYPGTNHLTVPSKVDANNYIVIDHTYNEIKYIYQYDIDTNKWNKLDGIKNVSNMSAFSATLDVKKQILFTFTRNHVTQIHLHNTHISTDTDNFVIDDPHGSKSIIVNNSLFLIGGDTNDSILKWNLGSKTMAKFSPMYNTLA